MRRRAGRVLHAAGRLRPQRGAPTAPVVPERPLLSVVVPVFQVEAYLAECLDSLLAQTYERLEVVAVDDGSTDGCAAILRDYAERDARVVVVHQENAGLGAARNAGLSRCTGDLVTFVDADDTVPPAAYDRMVRTLARSGSDFVVGAFVRTGAGRDRVRVWMRQAHAHERLAVTVDEAPEMLSSNVVACTKVFRRAFVDRMSLRFPEAVRYEDRLVMTRAYLTADAFDVIPDVVYRWRRRDDGTSISQRKDEMEDLLDVMVVHREVAGLLQRLASQEVRRQWYVQTFRSDVVTYARIAAGADDDYWRAFRDHLVATVEDGPADLLELLGLRVRLAVWLVVGGHREALDALVNHDGFRRSNFPVLLRDGVLCADVSFLESDDVRPPAELLRIRDVDLRMRPRLESLDWSSEGRLSVRCAAAVSYVDPILHDVSTRLSLRGPRGRRLDVDARPDPGPEGNLVARRPFEDQARSSVVADLDLAAVVAASRPRATSTWEARVAVTTLGMDSEATVQTRRDEGTAVLARAEVVDGALVGVDWSELTGLSVTVRRSWVAVADVAVRDGAFELDVLTSGEGVVDQVLVGGALVPAEVLAGPGPRQCRVRLLPADLPPTVSGRVKVAVGDRPARALVVVGLRDDPDLAATDGRALRVSDSGALSLGPAQPRLLVDAVEVTGEAVTLRGRSVGADGVRVRLVGNRAVTAWCPVETCGDGCHVRLPVRRRSWEGSDVPLPADLYAIEVAPPDDTQRATVAVLAGRLVDEATLGTPYRGWSARVTPDRRLTLRHHRQADRDDASLFGQHALQQRVRTPALRGPRRDVVVLESFGGTAAGDSPRALHDRLVERGSSLDLVWSVDDLAVAAPTGGRAVLHGSREWYDVVGSARLVVVNDLVPEGFVKAPGQVLLQTGTGTPLKHVGEDIMSPRLTVQREVRRLREQAATWDLAVSQGPVATGLLTRAVGFRGEVLEVGRPCSDVLLRPGAASLRERVRTALGVAEGQRVVLYAPTWRDDARDAGSWRKVLHLDARLLTSAAPDVTVLLRGHPATSTRRVRHDGPRIRDVTSYPDFSRLLLAADVLVTDYSSAALDVVATDTPVVLLVPDLEAYATRVRGLYLDRAELSSLGAVVGSTEELVEVLRDPPVPDRAAARARWTPLDDGGATDRVLDRLFAGVLPAP